MFASFTHNASLSSFFSLQNVGNARFVPHPKPKLVFPDRKRWNCSSVTVREDIVQTWNGTGAKQNCSTSTQYWLTVTVAPQSTHATVPYALVSFLTNYSTKITQHKTVDSKIYLTVTFRSSSNQFRYYTMKRWLYCLVSFRLCQQATLFSLFQSPLPVFPSSVEVDLVECLKLSLELSSAQDAQVHRRETKRFLKSSGSYWISPWTLGTQVSVFLLEKTSLVWGWGTKRAFPTFWSEKKLETEALWVKRANFFVTFVWGLLMNGKKNVGNVPCGEVGKGHSFLFFPCFLCEFTRPLECVYSCFWSSELQTRNNATNETFKNVISKCQYFEFFFSGISQIMRLRCMFRGLIHVVDGLKSW